LFIVRRDASSNVSVASLRRVRTRSLLDELGDVGRGHSNVARDGHTPPPPPTPPLPHPRRPSHHRRRHRRLHARPDASRDQRPFRPILASRNPAATSTTTSTIIDCRRNRPRTPSTLRAATTLSLPWPLPWPPPTSAHVIQPAPSHRHTCHEHHVIGPSRARSPPWVASRVARAARFVGAMSRFVMRRRTPRRCSCPDPSSQPHAARRHSAHGARSHPPCASLHSFPIATSRLRFTTHKAQATAHPAARARTHTIPHQPVAHRPTASFPWPHV
jgi:hypothetical protein